MKRLASRRIVLTFWLSLMLAESVVLSQVWAVATTKIAGHEQVSVSGYAAQPALGALAAVQGLLLLLAIWLPKWPRAVTLLVGAALTAAVLASSFGQVFELNFPALYKSLEQLSGEVSTPLVPGTAVIAVEATWAPGAALVLGALLMVAQLFAFFAQFGWPNRPSRYERTTAKSKAQKLSDDPIDIWDSQR